MSPPHSLMLPYVACKKGASNADDMGIILSTTLDPGPSARARAIEFNTQRRVRPETKKKQKKNSSLGDSRSLTTPAAQRPCRFAQPHHAGGTAALAIRSASPRRRRTRKQARRQTDVVRVRITHGKILQEGRLVEGTHEEVRPSLAVPFARGVQVTIHVWG